MRRRLLIAWAFLGVIVSTLMTGSLGLTAVAAAGLIAYLAASGTIRRRSVRT